MPIRPDVPDEPEPGDPAATPEDDAPEEVRADVTDDDAHGHGAADGHDADGRPLGTDDVDTRFAEIVTRLRGASDPRSWAPETEADDEHFEPPEPGPVLGGDPLLTMAWCAIAGVLLLVFVVAIAWRSVPTIVLQVAGVAFLAAVGLLIWRMPRDRDDDAGPGAVV
jgi:hypothetical protein